MPRGMMVNPPSAFIRHSLARLVSKKQASEHATRPLTLAGSDYCVGGSVDKE